jgi:hypothetical protein
VKDLYKENYTLLKKEIEEDYKKYIKNTLWMLLWEKQQSGYRNKEYRELPISNTEILKSLPTLGHSITSKSVYLPQCSFKVYQNFQRNFYVTQILITPRIPSSLKNIKS